MNTKEKAIKAALIKRLKHKEDDLEKLASQILAGDRLALSRGITLIESEKESDREKANQLTKRCLSEQKNSFRLGITGVPGVGKSSFIEAFGLQLIERGHKVAVLAIDPSSGINQGSILGDKTRMDKLSVHSRAFIRPTPTNSTLGGVAKKTREAMILCEAAGFDFILIETVGVGQSETSVKAMCDFFLLLMLSGAGDELQGIKRGIMEMADGLLITKSDGHNEKNARLAAQEYRRALHLFPPKSNGWVSYVNTISAHQKVGLDELYDQLEKFRKQYGTGWIIENRKKQNQNWFKHTLHEEWQRLLYKKIDEEELNSTLEAVKNNEDNPISAAQNVMKKLNA